MDSQPRRLALVCLLIAIATVGSRTKPSANQIGSARETLRAVGIRLSQNHSERELTSVARRGELVLALLEPTERLALGHGSLNLRLEHGADVTVAACVGSEPFWLSDQGFLQTGTLLHNEDGAWSVHTKSFEPGAVSLGVNSLDRSAPAHYVVFLRPHGPIAGDCANPGQLVSIGEREAGDWKLTVARAGVAPAHDVSHPFDKLPDSLIGSVIVQSRHSDRHSTLLAGGRVWKTHAASQPTPDQVVVSFGRDSSRELTFSWRTAMNAEGTVVRLAPAANPARAGKSRDEFRVASGQSTCIELPDLLNDPLIRRHQVTVDRLEPGTAYRYSCGDGTPEGWTEWCQTKTAPDRERGVRFLYLGDAQTGLERWGRLLALAYRRHPETDFLILAGDLVDRGNERTNWDHFFMRAAPVFRRLPLMPCVGNHEYLDMGPRLYRANFRLPANGPPGIDEGLVYSFEAGNGFFAMLDSTLAVSDAGSAREQAEWLDRELGRTRATWKFVIFHHPVYPSHPWRDTPILREVWVPIFDKHGVDLVLQGHDHAYLRTFPMRAQHRVDSSSSGTIYVIAVSGDKFVDQPSRDYIAVGKSGLSSYQTIETDPDAGLLTYRAWTEDGSVFDEVKLRKSAIR